MRSDSDSHFKKCHEQNPVSNPNSWSKDYFPGPSYTRKLLSPINPEYRHYDAGSHPSPAQDHCFLRSIYCSNENHYIGPYEPNAGLDRVTIYFADGEKITLKGAAAEKLLLEYHFPPEEIRERGLYPIHRLIDGS